MSDKLFRLAKSILQDDDKARDAVQELNTRLWEKRKMLPEIDNVPAFAMRSIRNLCLDTLRKNKFEDALPEHIEYKDPNPYMQTEAKDMEQYIKNIIDTLPEIQRDVMRLRDVEEMETEEIAYIMDMTENAVRVNLSRARQKVKEQILKQQLK